MKQFNSLTELAQAYTEYYNSRYSDPIKHFSLQDTLDICVTSLNSTEAKIFGISISHRTKWIKDFGYVTN